MSNISRGVYTFLNQRFCCYGPIPVNLFLNIVKINQLLENNSRLNSLSCCLFIKAIVHCCGKNTYKILPIESVTCLGVSRLSV